VKTGAINIVQLHVPIVAELPRQTASLIGTVSLNEVGAMFDKDILTQLKNECGGIQTVLKNCPDVFFGEIVQRYTDIYVTQISNHVNC
jgi:hypothetical protein